MTAGNRWFKEAPGKVHYCAFGEMEKQRGAAETEECKREEAEDRIVTEVAAEVEKPIIFAPKILLRDRYCISSTVVIYSTRTIHGECDHNKSLCSREDKAARKWTGLTEWPSPGRRKTLVLTLRMSMWVWVGLLIGLSVRVGDRDLRNARARISGGVEGRNPG